LPAGMVLSKGDDNKINESKQSGPLEFNLSPLVSYLIKPPIAILITIIGASVLSYSLYESKNLKVDYFNNKVLDDKHPINYGNIAIDQKMAGSLLVDLQVWGDEEAFKEIDNLQKIQIISDLSQKIFESKRVLNVAALLRDLKNSISGESSLPNSDEELSQLLMLLEGDENSGLFRLISPEFDKARISIYIRDLGANKILVCQNELIKKAEEILKGSGLKIKVTGMVSISASGFSTLAFELIYSLISALLVIILTIGIVFRSLRLAIASILPNLLPLMLPLLYYSISGNYLDLFASVCFVIAVGIAVDDTIHLLARFQEEYKKDKDFDRAIKISVNHSISAIISTSLILCFGFAILLFSQFPANRLFSKLSCVIIFLALFADLIFTPAVLSLLYPKKKA